MVANYELQKLSSPTLLIRATVLDNSNIRQLFLRLCCVCVFYYFSIGLNNFATFFSEQFQDQTLYPFINLSDVIKQIQSSLHLLSVQFIHMQHICRYGI